MDSASPIAARIAGEPSGDSGNFDNFAMETAEKFTVGGLFSGPASGYRQVHRRPSGEGQPA